MDYDKLGESVCTHTMYGETEVELLANAKKHGIEIYEYTEVNMEANQAVLKYNQS